MMLEKRLRGNMIAVFKNLLNRIFFYPIGIEERLDFFGLASIGHN